MSSGDDGNFDFLDLDVLCLLDFSNLLFEELGGDAFKAFDCRSD